MTDDFTFSEYQRQAARTDLASTDDLKGQVIPLLGLAGEVGSLLTEYKKFLREGNRYRPFVDHVAEEIGDVLWYLANLAEKAGLDLGEIAQENLGKLEFRWSHTDTCGTQLLPGLGFRYDDGFSYGEQLPRRLRVEFREINQGGRIKVQMKRDGVEIGDSLTDNAHIDDGYRYHDVFHLTNATLLGWSPVIRKLLSIKRKSNLRIDEVEDGARAAVTEEAISALVFGYAKDYSFFERTQSVDYQILGAIKLMTRPFEVRDRTARDWERAILQGYSVWRLMNAHSGGVFVGDADSGQVGYEKLTVGKR